VQVDGAVVEQFAVSGAQLYTETRGAGPLLLFVVGGNGDPAVFSGVADRLAADFTVVTYARRGFDRSPVDGPVDDANRICADVEDAVALIARCGDGPASTPATSPLSSAGCSARTGEERGRRACRAARAGDAGPDTT
jgi:pimeloyl-ACP methyl ester carboxylesterase